MAKCPIYSYTVKAMPKVAAMAKREASGNCVHEKCLLDYADTCLKQACDSYKLKFDRDIEASNECLQSSTFIFNIKGLFHASHCEHWGSIECISFFFPSSVIEELKNTFRLSVCSRGC